MDNRVRSHKNLGSKSMLEQDMSTFDHFEALVKLLIFQSQKWYVTLWQWYNNEKALVKCYIYIYFFATAAAASRGRANNWSKFLGQ